MATQNKKRDDEVLMWSIGGGIFTALLIFVDFGYSSFNEMPKIITGILYVMHGIISLLWILSFAKWKDPSFDVVRKAIVYLCIALSIGIALDHSFSKEDKQVIIDSKENAAKP